jgi:hypothetical protein
MRSWAISSRTLVSGLLICAGVAGACAQEIQSPRLITLKSGESVELRNYSFVTANCQSIMIGTPALDVLEGPEEISLTLKEGTVTRREPNCTATVPGGKVVATAKDIKEPKEAKLTIRLNYHTKNGDRQSSNAYIVQLFP